jgi:pimeloyl-ACP methyl ester carboxylesterase
MGGVIAQQLALDCPQRVRSLSLLCTFARGKDAARLTPWVLWMTLRTRIGTRPMRRRAFLEMICPRSALQTADVGALAARFSKLIGRDLADQPPILMKQLMAMGRHDTHSGSENCAAFQPSSLAPNTIASPCRATAKCSRAQFPARASNFCVTPPTAYRFTHPTASTIS